MLLLITILMFMLNAYQSCPAILGSTEACRPYVNFGILIIAEVLVNYICLHYYQ